jgi:hypothetical protein
MLVSNQVRSELIGRDHRVIDNNYTFQSCVPCGFIFGPERSDAHPCMPGLPRPSPSPSPPPDSPVPRRASPKTASAAAELLQENPRTRPFQPLDDLAHTLRPTVRDQRVNMVACHFPADDLKLMLRSNAAYQVAHTNCHLSVQHRLTVLGNPNDVHLEVRLRVRSQPVVSHATKLHGPWLRLKARGFHHPRWGH